MILYNFLDTFDVDIFCPGPRHFAFLSHLFRYIQHQWSHYNNVRKGTIFCDVNCGLSLSQYCLINELIIENIWMKYVHFVKNVL